MFLINQQLGGIVNVLPAYSTPIIIVVVILGVIGFIYSIRIEMRYREKMRKEMEEIRRTKRT
ncbi:MAG: hypothetical protein K0R28_6665 [Paenibacillus sp.]|jgi:hypothetical protein|nr:hypothetical protein [Paenibacillus sp.]